MKTDKRKTEIIKRSEKLDPNNNKNKVKKPMINRNGKKVHDDGFEHRTSSEIVTPIIGVKS